jgi:hypothetical protein
MVDFSYPLYDTAFFGTVAATLHTLFSQAQGASATLSKSVTNSRGAGQLPQNESYEADWLGIFLDEAGVLADVSAVWADSYAEFRVNDETVFLSPLRMLAAYNAWGGHYTQAAAADAARIGLMGDGLKLPTPIVIPGGTSFQVLIFQGTALSAVTQSVRFVMNGTLSRG